MQICDVVGTIVSTVKHAGIHAYKLLVVQPLGLDLRPSGATFLAVDDVSAGEGDRVLVSKEGGGARLLLRRDRVPVQAVVVAVVDALDIDPLID
jgi:ethanolamine utilization protein EutN